MIPPRTEYIFGSVQSLEHLHGGEDSESLRRMLIAYQYHIIRLPSIDLDCIPSILLFRLGCQALFDIRIGKCR